MDIFGIDINSIVDLGTHVATTGSIRIAELVGDDIFDYIISVVILVYELDPSDPLDPNA